jgi:hypothetical protein
MAQLEADIPFAFFALSIVRSLNGSAPGGDWVYLDNLFVCD